MLHAGGGECPYQQPIINVQFPRLDLIFLKPFILSSTLLYIYSTVYLYNVFGLEVQE